MHRKLMETCLWGKQVTNALETLQSVNGNSNRKDHISELDLIEGVLPSGWRSILGCECLFKESRFEHLRYLLAINLLQMKSKY